MMLMRGQTLSKARINLAASVARCRTLSNDHQSHKVLVVGGGAGGISVAASLARRFPNDIAIIEPSDSHFYQPIWTLVGGGLKNANDSCRPMGSVMPANTQWIQDHAAEFDPTNNLVVTEGGKKIKYDYLVVAVGMQLNFDQVEGLSDALNLDGVACNYSFQTVGNTFKSIQNTKEGNAIFTFPASPIKCAGAPQKIMYLAEEYFRKNNVRDKVNVIYKTPLEVLFAVPKYRESLEKICKSRDIEINFGEHLVAIDPYKKLATFEKVKSTKTPKERTTLEYAMIHVTPPMGPIAALKGNVLSDANGFVDVDQNTLQHKKFKNVFSLGDCSSVPTSKTAAAVAAQNFVLKKNLINLMEGRAMHANYDGYTSCPLVTGANKCILAEFDFNGKPLETFPIDQGLERRTMYHLKADVMPQIYWDMLLKGHWGGPGPYRKAFRLGMSK